MHAVSVVVTPVREVAGVGDVRVHHRTVGLRDRRTWKAHPDFKSALSSACRLGPERYSYPSVTPHPHPASGCLLFTTLTRVRAPQFLGLLLSDLSAPPVGVLVGVQLEKQDCVDSEGDDSAD